MVSSACASAAEGGDSVAENEDDDLDFGDEYDLVESDWQKIVKIVLVGIPAAEYGSYLYFHPEERKRIVDTALGGRYVDAAKSEELRKKLEKKISDLERVIKDRDEQNKKARQAIQEALKKQEEAKPGEAGTKVEGDMTLELEPLVSDFKACKDDLEKLRRITKQLEANPEARVLEKDYRSVVFSFCKKIKNDSVRDFFEYYLFLSAGNSTLFNFIHLFFVLVVFLSNLRTVVYGEDWTKLWNNPLVHKKWGNLVVGATWKRRTVVAAISLVDTAASFFVPYYGFFSAAAKLGTGLLDVMQGFNLRLLINNVEKGTGDNLVFRGNSPYNSVL